MNTKRTKKPSTPPEHTDERLKYCYTDASGNHYYEFIHDAAMPAKRFINAQVTEKMIRLGLSEQGIRGLIAAGKACALDSKRTADELRNDLFTFAANLEGRLGYLANHKVYENYASVFYVMQDEPVEHSDRWHMKKCDIWANDEAARDFFLHGAFKKLHDLVSISLEDMKASFLAAEVREQNLPILGQK